MQVINKIKLVLIGGVTLSRYTIELDDELETKLKEYMEDNNIKLRSKAIKNCILVATNKATDKSYIYGIDKKLNTILYRLNLNKKILEQIFSNMEFAQNVSCFDDPLLKQIYEEYNSKYFGRLNSG